MIVYLDFFLFLNIYNFYKIFPSFFVKFKFLSYMHKFDIRFLSIFILRILNFVKIIKKIKIFLKILDFWKNNYTECLIKIGSTFVS